MRICVITKCESWGDDMIALRGGWWRLFGSNDFPTNSKVNKRIQRHPFYPGEILILDKYGKEIGVKYSRDPYKWGCERKDSQGKCSTEFVIVKSLKEAIAIKEGLVSV